MHVHISIYIYIRERQRHKVCARHFELDGPPRAYRFFFGEKKIQSIGKKKKKKNLKIRRNDTLDRAA